MIPRARTERLLIQAVGGELVVYDLERQEAHSLNQTAALVFQHCDGRTSLAQLANLLHQELDLPVDEGLVVTALNQLERAHLLQDAAGLTAGQKVALAGAVALLVPVVHTLIAPSPAAAYSW